MDRGDKVLILTPMKDAEPLLDDYFQRLVQLTYPHELISLGVLESDSIDNTYLELERWLPKLKNHFRAVSLWKNDFGFRIAGETPRRAGHIQVERRSILAKSRNHLLFRALDDEDWVLWVDVDVIEYPSDIIQRLLATGKEIVQPHCVSEYGGKTFDRNAWRDKGKYRLQDLRKEGDLVKLHAVGGTMLLIRAEVHRHGLIFPTFLYGQKNPLARKNNFFYSERGIRGFLKRKCAGEIETEGLGLMAYDMGYECWGMPHLEIRHHRS